MVLALTAACASAQAASPDMFAGLLREMENSPAAQVAAPKQPGTSETLARAQMRAADAAVLTLPAQATLLQLRATSLVLSQASQCMLEVFKPSESFAQMRSIENKVFDTPVKQEKLAAFRQNVTGKSVQLYFGSTPCITPATSHHDGQ